MVRKYFRDARCLTDLVRCVIVCESVRVFLRLSLCYIYRICNYGPDDKVSIFVGQIEDLHMVLKLFMKKCVVGDSTEQQSSKCVNDEETLLGDDHEQNKFVLCQIKDRFCFSDNIHGKM